MNIFPLHAADFYKISHKAQYPSDTEIVYSNFTCRSDRLADVLPDFDHKAVFFGLQGVCQWLLTEHWNREFFTRPKALMLEKFERRMAASLGPNAVDAEHIGQLHDLGYLPVLIKALPEGSRVDMRVPMFTIRNTHPDFFWITNFLETQLSACLWKSITSATIAYEYRRLLERYAEMTGADMQFIPWQGHDFSMRGQAGIHDAAASGSGHLLSFLGTDTIAAIDYLDDYYRGGETFIGGSVPATEHSVMSMGGKADEISTFRRLITETYPSGIVSIVSDTWDLWRVLTEYAPVLKTEIMTRAPNALGLAKVVFRPDSGDPVSIICGDQSETADSPQRKGAVQCLWEAFGGSITSTGHRLLDPHVGLIYGDSITLDRAARILMELHDKGFASTNIVFGIGSFTYQHVTRDSFGTAIKATWGQVGGVGREIFKDPKTDSGVKRSARGLLRVEQEGDNFVLYDRQDETQERGGLLAPVFLDGHLVREESLQTIRNRLYPTVV